MNGMEAVCWSPMFYISVQEQRGHAKARETLRKDRGKNKTQQ